MLKGIDISKAYDNNKTKKRHEILKNVNLEVNRGELMALIGPSGSGKSTCLKALSLLDPPDRGCVIIDDQEFKYPVKNGNHRPPIPWPQLTIVFQQLFLWPHLTIRQNIELPLENLDGKQDHDYKEELIKFFELTDFVDRYPNEASLGQRQRAAIVRALALKPKYLLLDEVTSALDVEHVSKLLQHLRRLKQEGTAIMLVTHLIGFARQSADHIVFMDDGIIVESGGPELLTTPKSKRVAQFLSLIHAAH
jgi:ABC-type polar amino acid transport system ATPase subunit